MKRTRSYLFTLLFLALGPRCADAELVWLATFETSGWQTLISRTRSFIEASGFPSDEALLTKTVLETLNLASFDDISPSEPLQIFLIADSDAPRSPENPTKVLLLHIAGDVKQVCNIMAKNYAVRRENSGVTTLTTVLTPEAPRTISFAASDQTLMLSTSKNALQWLRGKQPLPDAFLPPKSMDPLRARINPGALPAFLEGFSQGDVPSLMLRDMATLAITLSPTTEACTLSLHVVPKKGTPLQTLFGGGRLPTPAAWRNVPENAFFSSVNSSFSRNPLQPYLTTNGLSRLLAPFAGTTAFTPAGDQILYFAPTRTGKDFIVVYTLKIADADAARNGIKELAMMDAESGLQLKPLPSREQQGQTIARYALSMDFPEQPKQKENKKTESKLSMTTSLISLFIKDTILELTIKDDVLIAVAGAEAEVASEIAALPRTTNGIGPATRIQAFDDSTAPLSSVIELRFVAFLRQLLSNLPQVKPEHLKLFPPIRDGLIVWNRNEANGAITSSIRLHSNEIATLQKVASEGSGTLQELFFLLFTSKVQTFAPDAQKE